MGICTCTCCLVCLTLLATFFLPSHLSFKNMYTCRSEFMYNVRVCNSKFNPNHFSIEMKLFYTVFMYTCMYMYMMLHVLYTLYINIHVHVLCVIQCIHADHCNEPRAFACTLYRYMYIQCIYNSNMYTCTCICVYKRIGNCVMMNNDYS